MAACAQFVHASRCDSFFKTTADCAHLKQCWSVLTVLVPGLFVPKADAEGEQCSFANVSTPKEATGGVLSLWTKRKLTVTCTLGIDKSLSFGSYSWCRGGGGIVELVLLLHVC